MRKILFICSTPYQLITILKIKKWYYINEPTDLLFTDAVPNMDKWLDEKILKKYFNDIFKVSIYEYAKQNVVDYDINTDYEMLNFYVKNEMSFLDCDYTDIFIANLHYWVINWAQDYKGNRTNEVIRFHYFDDGIYSYINYDSQFAADKIGFNDAYLYEKELVCVDYNIPINNLPVSEELTGEDIREIFVNGKISLDQYDYILLEHHFSDKKYYVLQDKIFDAIYRANPSNTVLKPHHRRRKRSDNKISVMSTLSPFEIMLQDYNKSLSLVTVFSTAVLFAPFMVTSPLKLIFLYRLFEDYFSHEEYMQIEIFIEKLRSKFKGKHQIVVLDTYEELHSLFENT